MTDVATGGSHSFKQATWEYAQNPGTAATKYDVIQNWKVGCVKDFSHVFSTYRDSTGSKTTGKSNPNAANLNLQDIENWDTSSCTTLQRAFFGASSMNAGLSKWAVSKVTTLQGTFQGASKFTGASLNSWITTAVTTLENTFAQASSMNSDLSSWKVEKVTTLYNTFNEATKFAGVGLNSWKTGKVSTLYRTFYSAVAMNGDISTWIVNQVTTMENTFDGASKFVGTGLSWNTFNLATLRYTFSKATAFNSDLSAWKTNKVTTMENTFSGASKFVGTGLSSWNTFNLATLRYTFSKATAFNSDLSKWHVAKVKTMENTFSGASKFVGTGLNSWNTGSLTRLDFTFRNAVAMNGDISTWNVRQVTTLQSTFEGASKFEGKGLASWFTQNTGVAVPEVKTMSNTFLGSLTSCNKRRIADFWAMNPVFAATSYPTDWATDTCTVRIRFACAAYARTLLCTVFPSPLL